MFEKRVSQSERRIRNSHVTSMRTACTGSTPLERSAGRGHRFPAHDIYIDNRSELRKMRHRADSAMRRTLFRAGAREGLSYLAIYLSLIYLVVQMARFFYYMCIVPPCRQIPYRF